MAAIFQQQPLSSKPKTKKKLFYFNKSQGLEPVCFLNAALK